MKRVLVLTRKFRGTLLGYGSEFEKYGCTVKTIISSVYCSKWNILFRIRNRFGQSNDKYMERKDRRFAKRIFEICEEFKPDIIYVCHGTQLRSDTVDTLKKKYYMVADLVDKLEFFPVLKDYVGHYDMVYTYIKADCEYLNNHNIMCKYLPAIGNSRVFYPMNINKDIDICFVGATYPEKFYGDRKELIDRLIEDFPDAKIFVGGECAPIRRPEKFLQWFFNKKRRQVYNNRDINSEECNVIYNRTKICLNINRINTGDGWSERFGNIMFSGSFQIVTYTEAIERTFGDMVETFHSYEELRDKIKFYLSHYDILEKRASNGYNMYLKKVQNIQKELNIIEDILENSKKLRNNKE